MRKLFVGNRNLAIIALIAIVNALGYGIVIPVLYSYSVKFGLTDFQNGLLFALFSLCQFLSTPIIGRFSDKLGRRPLLIASLAGTTLSFFIMAFAPSAAFLFIARALDGLTAGNIPVASAVISDTTTGADRAKGFGIIGASFSLGMILGPAISALSVGISPALPFIIAGAISAISVVVTVLYLPETNTHSKEIQHAKMFDFSRLFHALIDKRIGLVLVLSLLNAFGFAMLIYAYQPYATKILSLNSQQIALLFVMFGVLGMLSQLFILSQMIKRFGIERSLSFSLIGMSITFLAIHLFHSLAVFIGASIVMGLVNVIQPLIQTVLARDTDQNSQGSLQGLNASYMSIGQILGPIIGGTLATFEITYPFLLGSIIFIICFFISIKAVKPLQKIEQAFETQNP
ncbi:TCR/Tet family MFS transporter [candidate division WWE3 bacterium]|nr:TCR/Tet family MFS transporter [candidate division WWE3 bacterium]